VCFGGGAYRLSKKFRFLDGGKDFLTLRVGTTSAKRGKKQHGQTERNEGEGNFLTQGKTLLHSRKNKALSAREARRLP